MKIIDVHAREERIQVNENDVLVYSHDSIAEPGQHIVKVMWKHGNELCVSADTRGEGLVYLADHLKKLSAELRKMAFEQEGCTGLTIGDLK